jgi:hypothetical protein
MTETKPEAFATIVKRVLEAQTRGLPKEQLASLVRAEIGERRYRELARTGFERQCISAARSKGPDGLPFASDVGGRYVPRHLWTYDEYEHAMWVQARQARSATKRFMAYHVECGEKFDYQPDLDAFIAEIDFDAIAKEVVEEAQARREVS